MEINNITTPDTIKVKGLVLSDDEQSLKGNDYIIVEPVGVGNAAAIYLFGAKSPRQGGPETGGLYEFTVKPQMGLAQNFTLLHTEKLESKVLVDGAVQATAAMFQQRTVDGGRKPLTPKELEVYKAAKLQQKAEKGRAKVTASAAADQTVAPAAETEAVPA